MTETNSDQNSAPQILPVAPSREENDIFSILKSRVKLGQFTQEKDNKIQCLPPNSYDKNFKKP